MISYSFDRAIVQNFIHIDSTNSPQMVPRFCLAMDYVDFARLLN